jgi:eukaryotic-like serine/threonine-protein kinase
VRRLGAGGMAEVYLARSSVAQNLTKQLVIKKIHPAFARSPDFVRMFIDEAKIALGLNHPNIVQVFDFGQVGQSYFLAMEHVDGVDLLRLMHEGARAGRRVPHGLAAYLVQQVAKGLDYAHRKTDEYGDALGIVHRDISPQNLLVSWDGAVKIVDFGIARARDVEEDAGVVKGKLAYMSPEQARGAPVDRRADVYAAGIVLFELACARPLFPGKGKAVLEAVRAGAIPRPRDCDPTLPAALEELLLRALAYHPDDRFQTARDLQHALGRFQLQHAQAAGELHDSGTLAQFVAQIVVRDRPAARAAPPVPDAAATPVERKPGTAAASAAPPGEPAREAGPGAPILETRERKQVLVLWAELAGLDALARHVGEARAQRAASDFLRVAEHIAYKHDAQPHASGAGRLTYVVGVPVASEDDTSRAIGLALALVDALDGIGRDVEPELRLSVGIQRGVALVTRVGGAWRYELPGATSWFARRLAQSAHGGEVLVGGAVYRVARADWSFEELATIDLADDAPAGASDDGASSRRAKVYRLRGPKAREQRMRERSAATPLLGRELPLKTLRDVYRDVCIQRSKKHVLISGEEGIGKRSLVSGFLARLPPGEALVLRAACRAATSDTPFSVLADLTRDLLGLAEGAEPREVQRRLAAGASLLHPDPAGEGEVQRHIDTVATLLAVEADGGEGAGEMDAERRRARIVSVLDRIEARLSRDQPLIVVIEDVHWADSQSWEVFMELVTSPAPRPVLGIATSRPDERVVRGAQQAAASTVELALGELTPDERMRLVLDHFAAEDEAAARPLAEAIVAKAGGNPFFIREMMDSLLERGILLPHAGGGGKLTWDRRDAPLAVPTQVAALVATRLDRLPALEKETLSRAAVFGREFGAADVAALVGRDVAAELGELLRRQLVETRASGLAFRNETTQTVAYDLIPADERAPLHRRAAERLAAAPGYRTGQDDAVIARHLELAGDGTAAARRYLAAAHHARDVRGNLEAFRLLTRALTLLPRGAGTGTHRFAARAEREAILRAWAQRPRQLRELHLLRREAEALGDPAHLATALGRLTQFYLEVGRPAGARRTLPAAKAAARASGDRLAQAEALRLEAILARSAGENEAALSFCQQALELCAEPPGPCNDAGMGRAGLLERAQILGVAGTARWYLSQLREAIQSHAEALVIYRKLGVPRQEARALNNMGIVFSALGEFEEALAHYKRALQIDQELGDRAQVALKLANLGSVYVELGDPDQAESVLAKALAIAEQLGDPATSVDATITLGQAQLKRDQPEQARKTLLRGLELAEATGNRYQEIRAMVYLALAQLRSGDPPQAVADLARRAQELAGKAPLPIGEIYALAAQALALARLGQRARAAELSAAAVHKLDAARAGEGAEEILHIHARLSRAAGREAEAALSLERAHQEILSKARRLKDDAVRSRFLLASPAREILADVASRASPPA